MFLTFLLPLRVSSLIYFFVSERNDPLATGFMDTVGLKMSERLSSLCDLEWDQILVQREQKGCSSSSEDGYVRGGGGGLGEVSWR